MRAHPGIYVITEQRIQQKSPGPRWLGDRDATTRFFAKLSSDGFEICPTSGNRALLKAPGRADRIIWLETERGKCLPLRQYLRP